MTVVIGELSGVERKVEMVERKGLGHPDTICDALAEELSRALCRTYRDRFGAVLHHNVDKALLRGGQASPRFGGGTVDAPIDIYLAGRAIAAVGDTTIPIDEIVAEVSGDWLARNMLSLDAERQVRVHNLVRPGSVDLRDMFERGGPGQVALANDTSFGVGFAPLSPLERLVLDIERAINGRDRRHVHPAWGEDIKVMGARRGDQVDLTIACAMVDRHIRDLDAYVAETGALDRQVREMAAEAGFTGAVVAVNAADDRARGSVYMTVTGTSAEAGDDGQVGRGNRANGLITPHRPMSLEALAGKNPVSHVGKLYNVAAREIAEHLVAEVDGIEAVECFLLSRIGAPVTQPALAEVRARTRDGRPAAELRPQIDAIVDAGIDRIPKLVDRFIDGTVEII
jgi:S-adenosylmethionine synthetase